ncbi:MAG TPA: lycopene cyclase family protein [Motilibacteraceae bacterium]|nr:lycopene cyclase family protein [Motilibacteraceae bacterium]
MSARGRQRWDAVLAGGGLSGPLLLAHLARSGWGERVLLVDDAGRGPEGDEQRWAGWGDAPSLLDRAVERRFDTLRVVAGGVERVLPLRRYRYQSVRRADLHRVLREVVADRPGFVWRTGQVQAVRDIGGAAQAVVDGEVVDARFVFDSRPPSAAEDAALGAPDARLAFTGWRVRTERPAFADAVPTLVDFRTPADGAARFVYVLPIDEHRALVERTAFLPARSPVSDGLSEDAALSRYLEAVLGVGPYDVVGTEHAVLPLRARTAPRAHGRVVDIGMRAGLVRASTGYAMGAIVRDTTRTVAALLAGEEPRGDDPLPARHHWLDAVLLDAVSHDPSELERAFARLFAEVPVDLLLRFLDGRTTPREELTVLAALPRRPYLRAAARVGEGRR